MGRLRDRNDGLPLGNNVKWLGGGRWRRVERQRVEEEFECRAAVDLNMDQGFLCY